MTTIQATRGLNEYTGKERLVRCEDAVEDADFDLTELAQLLAQTSRGRHGQAQADEIQALARQIVGVGSLGQALRVQMSCHLQQLDLLEVQRQQLEAEIAYLIDHLLQHITSIPGIGRSPAPSS